MSDNSENFKEWDEIFEQREAYLKLHPDANNIKRPKTFEDENGDIRCTKCGSTQNISTCPECVSEKEFLKEQNG